MCLPLGESKLLNLRLMTTVAKKSRKKKARRSHIMPPFSSLSGAEQDAARGPRNPSGWRRGIPPLVLHVFGEGVQIVPRAAGNVGWDEVHLEFQKRKLTTRSFREISPPQRPAWYSAA